MGIHGISHVTVLILVQIASNNVFTVEDTHLTQGQYATIKYIRQRRGSIRPPTSEHRAGAGLTLLTPPQMTECVIYFLSPLTIYLAKGQGGIKGPHWRCSAAILAISHQSENQAGRVSAGIWRSAQTVGRDGEISWKQHTVLIALRCTCPSSLGSTVDPLLTVFPLYFIH